MLEMILCQFSQCFLGLLEIILASHETSRDFMIDLSCFLRYLWPTLVDFLALFACGNCYGKLVLLPCNEIIQPVVSLKEKVMYNPRIHQSMCSTKE